MNWSTNVRHLMTRDPVFVEITSLPSRLAEILDQGAFHHLPVLDRGQLVGVVSTVDLAKHSLGAWLPDSATDRAWLDSQFTAKDVMTWEPVFVRDTDTVLKAAEKLAEGGFHALPVLDDADALVGMLTSTDLLRWMLTAR